jgi:hypothetical protein
MSTFYEVWDDSTGNRLGEYETLVDARALLRYIFDLSGPDAVRSLAVIAYVPTPTGDYDVTTALEGADFVAGLGQVTPVQPSSSASDRNSRGAGRIDRSA